MRRYLLSLVANSGFDPRVPIAAVRGMLPFLRDYFRFRRMTAKSAGASPPLLWAPMLADRYLHAGSFPKHYFHQDLWAARRLYELRPSKHVDVASRIDGFVAHVLPWCPVEVLDIRPLKNPGVPNLTFRQADLMNPDETLLGSCETVSCLHAIEHFGLGRYGDTVDPDGYVKGLHSVAALVRPGGTLLLSVPIASTSRIEFNAQRVFAAQSIVDALKGRADLVGFSYLDDSDNLQIYQLSEHPIAIGALSYGCGLFEFMVQH